MEREIDVNLVTSPASAARQSKRDIFAERASRLQKAINDRIAAEAKDWHPLQYRTEAERIASEMGHGDWEWMMLEGYGVVPRIALTQYIG